MISSLKLKEVLIILVVFFVFNKEEAVATKAVRINDNGLVNKADAFILQNETSGAVRVKAWKDTAPTICNGITYYYFFKNDVIKQNGYIVKKSDVVEHLDDLKKIKKYRKCEYNKKHQLYKCKVSIGDIRSYQFCKNQAINHILYNIMVLQEFLQKDYFLLTTNQKIVLIDILFNYGESNKDLKKMIVELKKWLKLKNHDNTIALIESMYNIGHNKWNATIYNDGQMNRNHKRISKFFSAML